MLRSIPFLCACLMLACGPTQNGDDDPTPTQGEALATVTWHQDVAPLLNRTCVGCHMEGGVGAGDFSDYAQASAMAPLIASAVSEGRMPPVVMDPTCRDYDGSEYLTLSQEEKALLTQWALEGAPEGDPEAAAAFVPDAQQLNDVDVIFTAKAPHSPKFDATGNAYDCFVLENTDPETFFATAFDARIDRRDIVHHLALFQDSDGSALERYGTEPFDCMNTQSNPDLDMSGWDLVAGGGPSGAPIVFPKGTGIRFEPGQNLILQLHYYESSPGAGLAPDQSGYAMKATREVLREINLVTFGPFDFLIPAGDESYSDGSSYRFPTSYLGNSDKELIGVFPHMHALGQSYRAWVERENGETECMTSGDYDFYNQQNYIFKDALTWGPGETLHVECTWNNSTSNPHLINDPPKDAGYGEGTDDEMCFFMTFLVDPE